MNNTRKTFENLKELFRTGTLGKLLTEQFNGKRGRVYPNEDAEFLIIFKSNEETPNGQEVREVVLRHYTELGFNVESDGEDSCQGFTFTTLDSEANGKWIWVVISTNYPFDGHNSTLKITTEIFE
jgi:hypothetical protein